MRIQRNKGFIPIDILIISQLMMTVAVASLAGARGKAMDASFQASAASTVTYALLCCDSGGHLKATPGEKVCTTGEYGNYPGNDYFASIELLSDCNSKGDFSIKFTPAKSSSSAKVSSAICTADGCNFMK